MSFTGYGDVTVPAPFQLLASHPALDFINTLDDRFDAGGPRELLESYSDLLAFTEQSALVGSREVSALIDRAASARAAKVLVRARGLREALAAVVYDLVANKELPLADSPSVLEQYFKEAQEHQELEWKRAGATRGSPWEASWQWGRFATHLELPIWAVAKSAMGLLTSPDVRHVHACKSDTCRWVFLDTSKNHSRRWCDMKTCGNRMKARRFQARQ
jgi:predicted RNA-binding Zn ribbon-like protein